MCVSPQPSTENRWLLYDAAVRGIGNACQRSLITARDLDRAHRRFSLLQTLSRRWTLAVVIVMLAGRANGKVTARDHKNLAVQVSGGLRVSPRPSEHLDLLPPSLLQPPYPPWISSPWWIAATEKLTMTNAPSSVLSGKIISSFTKLSGRAGPLVCPEATGQSSSTARSSAPTTVLLDTLLFALWMIDPESFAFYYVTDDQWIAVVPPVTATDPAISRLPQHPPHVRPADVDRGRLSMLYSRSALQLLAVTRVAYRLAHEISLDKLPEPVMTPNGPTWCLAFLVRKQMRDAISLLDNGPLLISFDKRLPVACIVSIVGVDAYVPHFRNFFCRAARFSFLAIFGFSFCGRQRGVSSD